MSTRSIFARLALAVGCLPTMAGCHSWKATSISPATLVNEDGYTELRVTRRTMQVITFSDVAVTNDSIMGTVDIGPSQMDLTAHQGLPLMEVQTVEVRRFSAAKTAFIPILGFLGYQLFDWFFDKKPVEGG